LTQFFFIIIIKWVPIWNSAVII